MSSLSSGRRRPRFNRRRGIAVAAAVAAVAGGATAVVASAAVPTADVGNILVFPDRDFVSVEGYQGFVGKTATLTATRNGQIIGQTDAVVQEGDVAFEVNHPGGVCWGVGAPGNLKVTPDLQAGDKINISINGADEGDTTVLDVGASDAVQSGNEVTVNGHIAADVDPAQIEQRIIQPALRTTTVAFRDVRAVPGPLTAARRGGYSSELTTTANPDGSKKVVAHYVFDTAEEARLAANSDLGERLMAWQVQDAAGNRQGVTIAEFGELGGPGFGGCPAGPGAVAPQAGQYSAVRSANGNSVAISWSAATAQAGAPAVTGYSVEAIAPDGTIVGKRTAASGRTATLSVDSNVTDYTYEVRALSGAKLSDPFGVATPATPPSNTVPTVTASPAGGATPAAAVSAGSVTLSGNTSDIYYTTDGSSPIEGDMPSLSAKLYTGAIPVVNGPDGTMELSYVGFNAVGANTTEVAYYKKPATPAPSVPTLTGTTSTVSGKSITARWNASTNATKYSVTLASASNPQVAVQESTTTSTTFNNLAAGTYTFTVTAIGDGGTSAPSATSAQLIVRAGDTLSIASAVWKAGDFRIIGTSSATTGTVTVFRVASVAADGTVTKGAQIGTPTAVTAAVAPATGGAFDIRFRNAAAGTANPGRIVVESSNGGISPPFTVTNK